MNRWLETSGYEADLGGLREIHPETLSLEDCPCTQDWRR